jgi:hypothetical protein
MSVAEEIHGVTKPDCDRDAKAVTQFSDAPQRLRAESRHCHTANGAAMLQAVAAWMEGRDIFDPPAELWEHADRLCGTHELAGQTVELPDW